MEYKYCDHETKTTSCNTCDNRIYCYNNCYIKNRRWKLCNDCQMICSSCGECKFDKFGDFYTQRCCKCNIISCNKCIKNIKYIYCKDCMNK